MIDSIRGLSIKQKLQLIVFVSSFSALMLASFFILVIDLTEFQQRMETDLNTLASMAGNRSAAALMFDDKRTAKENLLVFKQFDYVRQACIYDKFGQVFAQLTGVGSPNSTCPELSSVSEWELFNKHISIVKDIVFDRDVLGQIYINSDLTEAYWRKYRYLGLIYLVLFGSSLLTFILSTPLLKLIALPVKELYKTVQKISTEGDYSLRARKINNDELGVLVDSFNTMISTVEKQHQALVAAKNRYLILYDDNPTMVFNVEPNGVIISVNKFGARQLSQSTNRLHGYSIFDFVHADDLRLIKQQFEQCVEQVNKVHKLEIRMTCRDGRVIWVRGTARLITNENRNMNILLVCEDMTETRNLTEKIAYQACHDALTGLLNRSEFDRQIKLALESARNSRTEYALCYLDLDQFKIVNDTCGHLAGDELLKQLGLLLKRHIRQDDLLARLGGDEFGILMKGCLLPQAYKACEKIRNAIQDFNFAWEDRTFTVGVSIGIAGINSISGNSIESLKEADAACYAAKEKGRNRVHVFRPNDEELALRQGEMQWVTKIQEGLVHNKFCLFGQPIVPIAENNEGLHFETLVRYRNQKGHIIPPGAFLPAAERYNIAATLDRWVIASMFEWLAKRPGFLEDLSLCSVNLSGVSLSDESMLDFISETFSRWEIPTRKICFEITETAAIASLSNANRFIKTLKDQGCFFSLDDFGSGLSSFAYLKNLPVDFLKIDGLFVKDILDDQVDLAMVKSINEVGHVMDKKTIAEFVENEQIFNLLKELGVDYAQGYGLSKPLPLSELRLIRPFF
ncbi:MAG: EAL domain-containing protein [Gammaproteobacteria bacterium]